MPKVVSDIVQVNLSFLSSVKLCVVFICRSYLVFIVIRVTHFKAVLLYVWYQMLPELTGVTKP